MKDYTLTEGEVTMAHKGCISCKHCYIPQDFLTGVGLPVLYCNVSKDRPRSGDALNEPFDYYDGETYTKQLSEWREWESAHTVDIKGTCSLYEVSK